MKKIPNHMVDSAYAQLKHTEKDWPGVLNALSVALQGYELPPFVLSDFERDALETARSCAKGKHMLKAYKAGILAEALARAESTLVRADIEWSERDVEFAWEEIRSQLPRSVLITKDMALAVLMAVTESRKYK